MIDPEIRPVTAVTTVLVLDMANIVGSVPDGWWRDRAGAAERLLTGLARLPGRTVAGPERDPVRLARIVAVLEGRASCAKDPAGRVDAEATARQTDHLEDGTDPVDGELEIVRAARSGDDAIAGLVTDLVAGGNRVLVVTADRGLRARLPAEVATTGPGWLNALLGRA